MFRSVGAYPLALCTYTDKRHRTIDPVKPDCSYALRRKRLQSLPAKPDCSDPVWRKRLQTCVEHWAGHLLRSGWRARVAELRPFPAISGATQADFSALKTAWRRGMDSNPRYGIEMARAPCALQSRSGYELARAANPGPQVERATLEAAGSWSLMLGDDPAVQRNSVRLQTGIAGAFGRISH